MNDQEYHDWNMEIRNRLPSIKDELYEIRNKRHMETASMQEPMPTVVLENKPPEYNKFWDEVEKVRYGTIWNQPAIGDSVVYGNKHGKVIELTTDGDSVLQVRVQFWAGDHSFSMLIEPWKLEKDNV